MSLIKILLVEDNPGDARLIKETLRHSHLGSYEIKHVETLKCALEKLASGNYHIVFLDLGLPDSNGFDTYNKINLNGANCPVIVLTGNDDYELGRTIVRMGAQDFIVKGKFDENTLSKSIDYAIDRFNFQKIIEKKESYFRQIIEKNADGMIVIDKNDNVLYVNSVANQLLNATSKDLVGKPIGFNLNKEEISEETVVDPDGNIRILQLKVVNTVWDNLNARIATLRDITELKKNQIRVEHLNRLLKTIGNINHLIVNEKDKDKLLEKACKFLTEGGSYKSAWIGLFNANGKISTIYQAELDEKIERFKSYLASNDYTCCINELYKTDKVVNICNTSESCGDCPLANLFKDKGCLTVNLIHKGIYYGMLVVSKPSNLLNDKEEALLAEVAADIGLALHTLTIEHRDKISQEKLLWLNQAMKETANAVVLTDKDGRIEWVNPAFTKLTGYTFKEAVRKNPSILKSGKHRDEFYKDIWETIKSGRIWNGDIINKKKDGTLYTEEMTITPVKNIDGEITRYIAIKMDITERKRAEILLKESEEKFRSISS
ncbi:PAS domain S-box protein, partial [Bacteroidota bacterium]